MPNPKKIIRSLLPTGLIKVAERSYRGSRGLFWQIRYGFPAKGLQVVAITGTNGKTTTASYVNEMFKSAGLKTAIYTTAYIEIAGDRVPNKSHMTVSSQAALQKFFADARTAKVDWVVLEITSHALDQKRIAGVKVQIAAITNLTQEHLDYHKTMEAYAAAKARLFSKEYNPKWSIMNADDEWFDFFSSRSVGQVLSYGTQPGATLQMEKYEFSPKGSTVTAHYEGASTTFTTQLIGKFNAYNALAAYGVGITTGLSPEQVAKGLAALQSVPGRMEPVAAGQEFNVIVDFAITPDALQNAITALKEITKGKVIVVFGATGDRDKTKRGPMGEVVGKLADQIFLTDDETYTEDPEAIRQAVYEGIKQVNADSKTSLIDDRRTAIALAIAAAKPEDTVLLTGIGSEDYRNMGGKKEPWDERDVARELLANR